MEPSDMPLLNIFKKLFGILFSIFGLIGRILNKIICRAKRLRRDSGTLLPMTTDQISTDVPLSVPSNDMNEVEFEPWDAWDNGVHSGDGQQKFKTNFQSKAEEYRYKQQQKLKEPQMKDPDYFQDMSPEFQKAKKILVRNKPTEERNSSHTHTNKFAVNNFIPIQGQGDELGQWEENETAWENEASEDLSWEADAAIREKKRLDRERRQAEQQRKKLERESHRALKKDGLTAVKIS